MNYTISNHRLSVAVSDYGAELQSVVLDGRERLWQGDPDVWSGRSPILFPFVGRIKNGSYTFEGKEYSAPFPHGFARKSTFSVAEQTESSVTFRLTSSEKTKKLYPFEFIFEVTYSVEENLLVQSFRVENTGNSAMYYAFGAHPGFILPLGETEFSDWYLEFAPDQPLNQALLDGVFMSQTVVPCPYAKGNKIPLYHAMFDDDAFILTGLNNKIFTVKSEKSPHKIVADCREFDYVAFWQMPKTDAQYLCIEPWNGLPSDSKAPEDLTVKRDLRILAPKQREICSVSYLLD